MNDVASAIVQSATDLFTQLDMLDADTRLDAINAIRLALHEHSPLKHHPVDCVLWVRQDQIAANAYNPNAVAPPEMKLLERSIREDGYTQPVVTWQERPDQYEIVDGQHRDQTGELPDIYQSVMGRMPITIANQARTSLADRMASTIRHNRARGTHEIDLMQQIVAELVECGMSDQWIMRHCGMDLDELLRLKQLTGLAALFRDAEFSRAWIANEDERATYLTPAEEN
jgi:ParB-like chromosome segregation protein Spo0J